LDPPVLTFLLSAAFRLFPHSSMSGHCKNACLPGKCCFRVWCRSFQPMGYTSCISLCSSWPSSM
jgi:hypothetical protein